MSKKTDGRIECPFFQDEGKGFIICEGIVNGSECVHRFLNNDLKEAHLDCVCSVFGGRKCQHYRTISILYERGLKV